MSDISEDPKELELFHYGIKGMKWGTVRKEGPDGRVISRKTNRTAKKDANESAKAKMFYGEGAGTRRKLIKAKVNERSKDPHYKQAFEEHSSTQDMAKRSSQAKGTRLRKDTTNSVKKTARGVKNLALQTGAPVTLTAAALYGAYQNPKVRETVNRTAKQTYSAAVNSPVADIVKKQFGG